MREHAVAEAADEEGLRGCFAESGDHVGAAGVQERGGGAAEGEGQAFEGRERDVAWVVGGGTREDGEVRGMAADIRRGLGWVEDGAEEG